MPRVHSMSIEPQPDPVEVALAVALRRAAESQEWGTVRMLSSELEARREARAGTVDLAAERLKRNPSR